MDGSYVCLIQVASQRIVWTFTAHRTAGNQVSRNYSMRSIIKLGTDLVNSTHGPRRLPQSPACVKTHTFKNLYVL